jgi:ferric-dicitrate binding protein FerR (iron transport regulator)
LNPQDPREARRRRDLAALALIVAGVTGLLIVAYQVHPLLCWGSLAAAATAAGVLLGIGQ